MSKQEHTAEINAKVEAGLITTYNAMLAFKKYKQSPVSISRDGKIMAVPAEDMPLAGVIVL